MKPKKSQNSKILLDGRHLSLTKEGVMYKYGPSKKLSHALAGVSGGKVHASVKDALKSITAQLRELK